MTTYISTLIWPFSIKCVYDCMNYITYKSGVHTPYQIPVGLQSTELNINHFTHFEAASFDSWIEERNLS